MKIQLPGADITKLDLDVTDKFLDCRTSKWSVLGLAVATYTVNNTIMGWIPKIKLVRP